jgi:hypothetical protein
MSSEEWSARGERRWGAASGGGGRQLVVRGGQTRQRGAQGVVDSAEERLEWAVRGGAHRAGRSGGEGPEGLSGLERSACIGMGWSSRRRRSGRGWLEEAALGGPGCGGWHRHGARRRIGGASAKEEDEKGELIGWALPL